MVRARTQMAYSLVAGPNPQCSGRGRLDDVDLNGTDLGRRSGTMKAPKTRCSSSAWCCSRTGWRTAFGSKPSTTWPPILVSRLPVKYQTVRLDRRRQWSVMGPQVRIWHARGQGSRGVTVARHSLTVTGGTDLCEPTHHPKHVKTTLS